MKFSRRVGQLSARFTQNILQEREEDSVSYKVIWLNEGWGIEIVLPYKKKRVSPNIWKHETP